MITFKKNVEKVLLYKRKQYISFNKWYGVSFQLEGGFEGRKISLPEYLKSYESWFRNLILQLDNGSPWIVNHDIFDNEWFPNDHDTLKSLRTLFKENDIPNTFKGAIVFTKDDLLAFSRDLISYPSALFRGKSLYDNLDISHSEIPFVLKISAHRNIDLLSNDKELLTKLVSKNSAPTFTLKEYNSTSM